MKKYRGLVVIILLVGKIFCGSEGTFGHVVHLDQKDSHYSFCTSNNLIIDVWKYAGLILIKEYPLVKEYDKQTYKEKELSTIGWSPDNTHLVVCCKDGTVGIIDFSRKPFPCQNSASYSRVSSGSFVEREGEMNVLALGPKNQYFLAKDTIAGKDAPFHYGYSANHTWSNLGIFFGSDLVEDCCLKNMVVNRDGSQLAALLWNGTRGRVVRVDLTSHKPLEKQKCWEVLLVMHMPKRIGFTEDNRLTVLIEQP